MKVFSDKITGAEQFDTAIELQKQINAQLQKQLTWLTAAVAVLSATMIVAMAYHHLF